MSEKELTDANGLLPCPKCGWRAADGEAAYKREVEALKMTGNICTECEHDSSFYDEDAQRCEHVTGLAKTDVFCGCKCLSRANAAPSAYYRRGVVKGLEQAAERVEMFISPMPVSEDEPPTSTLKAVAAEIRALIPVSGNSPMGDK